MTTLRALIVDDEEPARELLRSFLQSWPNVSIVAEAADGEEAIALIRAHRPDVVFLDVQMPTISGFDVVTVFTPDELPLIVFVTAHDQYALRAFEISACDYLLKPFDKDRLANTLNRVFLAREHRDPNLGAAIRTLMSHVRDSRPEQIIVKVDKRHLFIRSDEIEWIEAVGKEVRLHVANTPLVVRESMNSLEQRLDPEQFVRIHRSIIVNRLHIREVQPWFKGDYVVILRRGARVVTGRTYRATVQSLIAGRSTPSRHTPHDMQ